MMENVPELRESLNKILANALFTQNSLKNRDDIYNEVRYLLDKYGLEDLHIMVESMQRMIDRFSDYVSVNYEELVNQIYIGPTPNSSLIEKLAWKYLTENK